MAASENSTSAHPACSLRKTEGRRGKSALSSARELCGSGKLFWVRVPRPQGQNREIGRGCVSSLRTANPVRPRPLFGYKQVPMWRQYLRDEK